MGLFFRYYFKKKVILVVGIMDLVIAIIPKA